MTLLLNGTDVIALIFVGAASGNATVLNISAIYELAAGDYVLFRAYQSSGGNLDVETASNYSPEFMIARLG